MVSARGFEETSVWSPEELEGSPSFFQWMKTILRGTDKWMSVEVCNWSRKYKLDYAREDEESRLPERLRNLSMTSSDVERVGKLPEKLKSFLDEQAEHSTCRGCRTMRHKACTRCTVSIRIWNKEDIGVVVGCDTCAKKKVECSSWEVQKTNGALKRNGA
jgi:hypothetical protein